MVQVTPPAGYVTTIGGNDPDDDNNTDSNGYLNGGAVQSHPVMLEFGKEPINDGDTDADSNLSVDFGFIKQYSATLGDYVWYDINKNGIQDASEPGIAGVTVRLLDAAANVLETMTTDGSGNYLFDDLEPGTYSVEFVKPAGYDITLKSQGSDTARDSDADLTTGRSSQITLGENEHNPKIDAGMYIPNTLPASLGDYVWYDANADGIQDSSEIGVAGVTVNLYNTAGVVISTTTTNGAGYYSFTGLAPGNYSVEFVKPSGYTFTLKTQGGDSAFDSDADTTTGKTASVILAAGEHNPKIDAGLFIPSVNSASLGDYVWYDLNKNGIQDVGETGVSGVTVNLLDGTGNIIRTTATDSSGYYLFNNLTPGTYSVEFVKPAGYELTLKTQGGDSAKDSDADTTTGKTSAVTLAAGEHNPRIDAGLYQPDIARLGDFVWYDTDNDGIQDAGEPGIAGVVVKLYNAAGQNIGVTQTDGTGYYEFTDLAPGTYSVEFVKPNADYTFSPKSQGTQNGLDSDADTATGKTAQITLSAGENNPRIDAGMFIPGTLPSSLGDRVWYDTDKDGIQDAGENGISGVTVTLKDASGNIIATTTTDGSGNYLFSGLAAGDYVITFEPPSGYHLSPMSQGGDTAKDSDAGITGSTGIITLGKGEH
ncbi:MAG: hypothetical protein HC887_04680, partial [Desulfobacteraceae bacterium]|nr:hypothetical protein [Desulfobacteraceae bacterium]